MKYFKKQFFVFFVILFSFFVQNFVSAESLLDRQQGIGGDGAKEIGCAFGECTDEPEDVRDIVINILTILFTFLGIIMVLLIIYGGYLWMTSAGNDEQVVKAKNLIRNAIIGVILIMASYGIVAFVVWSTAESTGLSGVS